MKKIEAIIRKTHFNDVKDALFEADINWFSYSEVKAIGQDREDRIYRGVMYSMTASWRTSLWLPGE